MKKRISSSCPGLHFGHYKAASFIDGLSALHAAKLSLCVQTEVSLAIWDRVIIVLLENIMGDNYIHKLRAFFLFISTGGKKYSLQDG